jgi:hypothetical protein
MCATMMAALVGFTSCEDDLDIQTNYPFEVEAMPVPTKVLRGQTVEIRCQLNKEDDYKNMLYRHRRRNGPVASSYTGRRQYSHGRACCLTE